MQFLTSVVISFPLRFNAYCLSPSLNNRAKLRLLLVPCGLTSVVIVAMIKMWESETFKVRQATTTRATIGLNESPLNG